MYSVADGVRASVFSYLHLSIGASDFPTFYSLDDVSGNTSFSKFNINNAPSCVFSVIKDILSVNPALKVRLFSVAIINMHVLMNGAHSTLVLFILFPVEPTDPNSDSLLSKPTEMMNGGTIASGLISAYPNYVLKAVQGFQNQGISNYAIPVRTRTIASFLHFLLNSKFRTSPKIGIPRILRAP
ncbi:hypothetical protein B0H11DRAFT_571136 [Mycena galericulata]|nr:hypothetical protein B0H11DRAFT_571136 [Mycena galericulata]